MDFLDKIFENTGSKIKIITKIFFLLELIAILIFGIIFAVQGVIGISLSLLLTGPIVAYLLSFGGYAMGEFLECTYSIANSNRAILAELRKQKGQSADKKYPGAILPLELLNETKEAKELKPEIVEEKKEVAEIKKDDAKPIINEEKKDEAPTTDETKEAESGKPIYIEDGRIKCPNCGKIQRSDRDSCYICGYVFKKEE